jgi:hypothetical protein
MMERAEPSIAERYAGERWTPKEPPATEEPGQLRATSRYLERFAAYDAEVAKPFKGITTDGNVVPNLFPLRSTGVSTAPVRQAAEAFLAALEPDQRARAQFPVNAPSGASGTVCSPPCSAMG